MEKIIEQILEKCTKPDTPKLNYSRAQTHNIKTTQLITKSILKTQTDSLSLAIATRNPCRHLGLQNQTVIS